MCRFFCFCYVYRAWVRVGDREKRRSCCELPADIARLLYVSRGLDRGWSSIAICFVSFFRELVSTIGWRNTQDRFAASREYTFVGVLLNLFFFVPIQLYGAMG